MARYRCRVEPHGPHQLELKIRYPVGQEQRSRYNFDLYIFLPAQLRVTRESYSSRRLIDDVLSHIRHTSPRITLSGLADPGNAASPLVSIKASLAACGDAKADSEVMVGDLRNLGNAFRSAIRTERSAVLRIAGRGAADDLAATSRALLADLALVCQDTRRLPALCREAALERRAQVAAAWADDWVSLNAEAELLRVWEALRGADAPDDLLEAVRARVRDETAHRRKSGYPSVVRAGDPGANERALHHESMLKKWAQGALYMSSEQLATSRGIGHMVAGIAAAAAMSFAVAATFLATHLFPANSIPWALMIVISYIFKDRIKEMLKASLSRFFPLLFFDRSGRLNDPSVDRPVGTSRETVRFCGPADCPPDVASLRLADGNPFYEVMPEDNVIHYNKIVKLRAARLRAVHDGLDSITEILRMKIDPWLSEMDDPQSRRRILWGSSIATVVTRRVYHAHLILALTSPDEQRSLRHYIAVLSRDGVQRVDDAGPDSERPAASGEELYESAASSLE